MSCIKIMSHPPKIKSFLILLLFMLVCCNAFAQPDFFQSSMNAEQERVVDFWGQAENSGTRFFPTMPSLQQQAGAKPAFWEYFWLFGDGSFSREETPLHYFDASDSYDVYLFATANYDTGTTPKGKKKRVSAYASVNSIDQAGNLANETQNPLRISAIRDARPNEENLILLSYQNNHYMPLRGKLHLFFNEKDFPKPYYEYKEHYVYFDETLEEDGYTNIEYKNTLAEEGILWASIDNQWQTSTLLSETRANNYRRDEIMIAAEQQYRTKKSWRFSGLTSGKSRNLFVKLQATPEMVEDTSVTISIFAALESNDGQFFYSDTLELPIVSAHDPNVIHVNDRKSGFRNIRSKKLKYKTQFQNTGKGPAEKVKLEIDFKPAGALDLESVEILGTHFSPDLPFCHEVPRVTDSCLDTIITKDKITITFNNIYLPGKDQDGGGDIDSTKGFVRYAIVPSKKMKRRPFKSQASIIFDKEDPVRTNWANTRFKRFEPSPLPMLGYRIYPNNSILNSFQLGIGVAQVYKAFGWYLQPEIHFGISKDLYFQDSVMFREVSTIRFDGTPGPSVSLLVPIEKRNLNYNIQLIPLHLRKNINDYFGIGIGTALDINFTSKQASYLVEPRRGGIIIDDNYLIDEIEFNQSIYNYLKQAKGTDITVGLSLFLDINLGSVRAGPVIGVRNYLDITNNLSYSLSIYGAWRL